MKILYLINATTMGGLERHVHCLAKSLPREFERMVCAAGCDGDVTLAMRNDGVTVHTLNGRNGHDFRIVMPFIRLLRSYKPDIVHVHSAPFFAMMILRCFPKIKVVASIHMPTRKRSLKQVVMDLFSRKTDYYLPVSDATWQGFKAVYPKAVGEVLFNPLNIASLPKKDIKWLENEISFGSDNRPIIGMIGRLSDQKDWFSFLKTSLSDLSVKPELHAVAIGGGHQEAELKNFWEKNAPDGCRERLHWLGMRDDAKQLLGGFSVFIMTSEYEEMPTTLLEAFGMGVPVAGFTPRGGVSEVIALAKGKPIGIFRNDRSCEGLAKDVITLLDNKEFADECVRNAKAVLDEYFNADNVCKGQLVDVYKKVTGYRL